MACAASVWVSLVHVARKHPPMHVVGVMRYHYHLGVVIEPERRTYEALYSLLCSLKEQLLKKRLIEVVLERIHLHNHFLNNRASSCNLQASPSIHPFSKDALYLLGMLSGTNWIILTFNSQRCLIPSWNAVNYPRHICLKPRHTLDPSPCVQRQLLTIIPNPKTLHLGWKIALSSHSSSQSSISHQDYNMS
ncbi:hypothetical protein OJAV_G00034460 [Oryzias javanicus]|uniref:Uncharacterized protein n=1 Tax=Oryzias javanicus TaxID=123683 RepID=A0A3S2PR53_ORYJA|nr:hypothetical protein OJAV_G00034460 [Oryzias javanicus]